MSKVIIGLVSVVTSVVVFVGMVGAEPFSWLGFYQPKPPKVN